MLKDYRFYTTLLIILMLLFSYSIYDYYRYNENREQLAIERGIDKRDAIKDILNIKIDSIEIIARNLSRDLTENDYSKKEIEELIKRLTLESNFNVGIAVAFKPQFKKDSTKLLYAPFYSKRFERIKFIEDAYDYTNDSIPAAIWYTEVMKQKKEVWSIPYISEASQGLVVDFGLPFYKTDQKGAKQIAGIVSVTLKSAQISEYLHDISLGKSGYSFITTKDFYPVSHPTTELLTKGAFLRDQLKNDVNYKVISKKKEGHFTTFSTITKENAEFFFTTLNQGWVVSVVMPRHDLLESSSQTKNKLIIISILLTLTMVTIFVLSLKIWEGTNRNLWFFSFLLSVLLLANIAFLWYLNLNIIYNEEINAQTKVLSQTTIDNYLNERDNRLQQIDNSLKHINIPTGIFVYDFDFLDAYHVAINGKIWQKVPDSITLDKEINFVFPQASATGISVRIRPMLKKHIEDYWLYRSDFNATFEFDFNYLQYPLNLKKVNLQIKYPNMDELVVFTPDLQSYDFIDPVLKPGISNDLFMPNSLALSSYFTFDEHDFESDLGNENYKGLKETPVLTFNVLIKNLIINSIISNIIPTFIIAVMVFLLPFTVNKENGEVLEGGSLNLIQAAGGFFFILVLAHIQLRNDIETPGLIYLETIYFVMYVMLAVMSAAVMVFLKTNDYPLLEYKQNLIFRISYWPILMLSIYLITLFIVI